MYLKNVYLILHLCKKSPKPVYQLIGHFVVTSLTGFDKDQTEVDIEEKKACLRKGNTTLITQLHEERRFSSKGCLVMNYFACLVSHEFCLCSWLPNSHSYASLYSWYCFNFPIHIHSHLHESDLCAYSQIVQLVTEAHLPDPLSQHPSQI